MVWKENLILLSTKENSCMPTLKHLLNPYLATFKSHGKPSCRLYKLQGAHWGTQEGKRSQPLRTIFLMQMVSFLLSVGNNFQSSSTCMADQLV
jgi:hypothetical protein